MKRVKHGLLGSAVAFIVLLMVIAHVPQDVVYRFMRDRNFLSQAGAAQDISRDAGQSGDTRGGSEQEGGAVALTRLPVTAANVFSIIEGKWHVSSAATVTNHANAAETGSLAWVVTQLAGAHATVELPPGTYAFQSYTIPANVHLSLQAGALLAPAAGQTLTFATRDIHAPEHAQIFAGAGSFAFADGTVLRSSWFPTLAAAVPHLGASKVAVRVNRSESIVTLTTHAGTQLLWEGPGNVLNVSGTLTVNGPIQAGLYRIFSGKVVFGSGSVRETHPEWWSENAIPGTTDMTAAIRSAIHSVPTGGVIRFLATRYLSDPVSISNLNNLQLVGAGREATRILLRSAGTLLTFSNCQWLEIEEIMFAVNGNPQGIADSSGMRLDNASMNSQIRDCAFVGFAKDGLQLYGTASSQLSGHKVSRCYFLGNGGNQLHSVYSHDFHIEDNQFGRLEGYPHAAAGCFLDNSNAGNYTGNYHWRNVTGFKGVNAHYNRIVGNRFEESDRQGVYYENGAHLIFTSNTIHTNSRERNGLYDNAYFKGVSHSVFADNSSLDWTAGRTFHRWGFNFDTDCNDITVAGNKFSSFGSAYGPIRFDGTLIPERVNVDAVILGVTSATVAAGTTTYLGLGGSSHVEDATGWVVGRKAMVVGFFVDTDRPPGAGESYVYTLRKTGADTGMTCRASGASAYHSSAGMSAPAALVGHSDQLAIRLETSPGAAAAHHRYAVLLAEY